MKVAFVTHYTGLYGANRSLLNLIDGLRAHNVTPYVIAPAEGDITHALRNRNVQVATYPIQWWVANPAESSSDRFQHPFLQKMHWFARYRYHAAKRLCLNLKLIPVLREQLKTWAVNLVYTNSSVIPVSALVADSLKLPHVWHFREFIDMDYNFRHDWGKSAFNQLIKRADARIAISKSISAHLLDEFSPEQNHIVYNGIASVSDFDRLHQIKTLTTENKAFTFALVGLVHPNKGQDVAIRALALLNHRFPQARLLIVGMGDTAPLKNLVGELGIQDKVEFWGHVDDPYKAYLSADVVLMCSKNEGMGRVTVEAMSACRPVIGYDNAGTSEIIQHEQTGLLYQGGPEALAAYMKKCIEQPDWAKQLGENAWQMAREEYSTETYAKKVHEILVSVTERKMHS